MLWTDTTLSTLAMKAEEYISMELLCITDRISVKVTKDISLITLPDYVLDIVRVTWKGYSLDPYPMQQYIEGSSAPLGITSGQPRYYIYSGYGSKVVKLVPAPDEALSAAISPIPTKTQIMQSLTIDVKRLTDISGTAHRIPAYYRRRLVKDYVCWKAFAQEGSGQNLAASKYYHNKFTLVLGLVKEIHSKLFTVKRYEMSPQVSSYIASPGRPVLPGQFGIVVD